LENTEMALGNKGFGDLVVKGREGRAQALHLPPRTGILGERENRLAQLATGTIVNRRHEFIDPARCRIWEAHNRDYVALSETACADLIESFRAQGRQEVPAIVRRVTGDPAYEYEVICGARRHWTVTWLRANAYPEFKFLIEPRELSDEEAFRVAERATDYARAIDRYYGGSQQKMIERLEVSKSWMSRYLELARLPAEVIAAFETPHVIGISHAAQLAPLLKMPANLSAILEEALLLAADQTEVKGKGGRILPAVVVRRLALATRMKEASTKPKKAQVATVHGKDGRVLASAQKKAGGKLEISVPHFAHADGAELIKALGEILAQMAGGKAH
jgi:ParB family chromosome partitioning protein